MEHLSEQQIATLRAKLEAEAADLRERVANDAEEIVTAVVAEPGDIEDSAAADAQRFRTQSMLTRDRRRLSEVEAALARIDAGSYGVCEETDEPIPYRRLELEPTARFTVEALELLEGERGVFDPHGNEPIGY
jgi:DnaK suppressor protein